MPQIACAAAIRFCRVVGGHMPMSGWALRLVSLGRPRVPGEDVQQARATTPPLRVRHFRVVLSRSERSLSTR